MHVSRIDLNLYVVFEAIYAEGSITRAAARLHLTQPAVSHALARLRDTYGDPLFVRSGSGVAPSVLARQLIVPVRDALGNLQSTLQPTAGFDASTARNSFAISLPDVLESRVLPALMARWQDTAPNIHLTSVRVPRRSMDAELAAGRIDLAFDVPLPVGASIHHEALSEDRFVVAMRAGHPLESSPWNLDTYLQARHIVVSSRRTGLSAEDFELSRLGRRREIALRCSNYHVAWRTVQGSNLLLTLPARYAGQCADAIPVRPVPAALKGLAIHMYWHEASAQDPASLWLRAAVREVVGAWDATTATHAGDKN